MTGRNHNPTALFCLAGLTAILTANRMDSGRSGGVTAEPAWCSDDLPEPATMVLLGTGLVGVWG